MEEIAALPLAPSRKDGEKVNSEEGRSEEEIISSGVVRTEGGKNLIKIAKNAKKH